MKTRKIVPNRPNVNRLLSHINRPAETLWNGLGQFGTLVGRTVSLYFSPQLPGISHTLFLWMLWRYCFDGRYLRQ
jgi:hypothetical protein